MLAFNLTFEIQYGELQSHMRKYKSCRLRTKNTPYYKCPSLLSCRQAPLRVDWSARASINNSKSTLKSTNLTSTLYSSQSINLGDKFSVLHILFNKQYFTQFLSKTVTTANRHFYTRFVPRERREHGTRLQNSSPI